MKSSTRKMLARTLIGSAAAVLLTVAVGCEPAKPPAPETEEPVAAESSNTTSNTTAGSETPVSETPVEAPTVEAPTLEAPAVEDATSGETPE